MNRRIFQALSSLAHHLRQQNPPFPAHLCQAFPAPSASLQLTCRNSLQATDASCLTQSGEAIGQEYFQIPSSMKFILARELTDVLSVVLDIFTTTL